MKLIVRSLAVLILWISSAWVFAQNPADSLRKLIHEADEPRNRIDLQNQLASELLEVNLEESFQTSGQALRESRRYSYLKGEGQALISQALYYKYIGQPRRAIKLFQQLFPLASRLDDAKLKATAFLQCGRVFRDIGQLDSAEHHYHLAESEQLQKPDDYILWQISTSFSNLHLLRNEPAKALEYSERSLSLAERLNRAAPKAYAYLDLGNCVRDLFDFEKAHAYYKKALDLNGQYDWLQTDYQEGVGQLYYLQGDFEKASEAFRNVIKAYEAYKGRHKLTASLIKMGQVLEELGLYNISSEYLYKALRIAETSGYLALEADALYQMARIDYQNNQLSGSMTNVLRAERLFKNLNNDLRLGDCQSVKGIIYKKKGNFDSAMLFHQAGLKLRVAAGNNKTAISNSLFNIGALYLSANRRKEALDYFTQGIQYDEAIGDRYGVCQYKNNLGSIYTQNQEYDKASEYLNSALALATQSSSPEWVSISYGNLAVLCEARGDMKQALQYYKQFKEYGDNVRNKSVSQSLASSRALYEIDQKDRQIELLNRNQQAQEDQIRLQNILLYGTIALAIVLAILAFTFYYYTIRLKRLNAEVQERTEEIQTQSEELMESNTALTNLNREISNQQDEIKHQAEELKVSHETIAKINEGLEKMVEQRTTELRTAYQELDTFFYRSSHDFRRPLTTLMGLAEVAKLSVKDQNALELFDKVNLTAINLDKMLVKLQSISDVGSHQLVYKEVLLKSIVDNALDAYKEKLQDKSARVNVDIKLARPFTSFPVLIKVIIENLIENAIQFSAVDRPQVQVRAFRRGDVVVIEVEDNGEGIREDVREHVFEMFFRGSERSGGNGLGLYIAGKAVEKISGKISFENNQEKSGTTFRVQIPDHA